VRLDLHLTDSTELHASSRVDDTGQPFAEIQWDFHGSLPEPLGNGVLWGTTAAMRQLAELILEAVRLAEEEAAWQTHPSASSPPSLEGSAA
jgi:DNA-binding GntR family transcriptional regulator